MLIHGEKNNNNNKDNAWFFLPSLNGKQKCLKFQKKKEERNLYDKLLKKMMEISKSVYFFWKNMRQFLIKFLSQMLLTIINSYIL